jgi:hypothetical protein
MKTEKLNLTWKLSDKYYKIKFVKTMVPGVGWGHNRGNCFYICLYRKNIFKIYIWITTGREKLNFTWNLSEIVQNQVYLNHGLGGSDGATIWETVFTCVYTVYIEKAFSQDPLH